MSHHFIYVAIVIGRITSLARASVCPSRTVRVPHSKTKRCRKTKIGVSVPQGRTSRCASFQLQRSNDRATVAQCIVHWQFVSIGFDGLNFAQTTARTINT